MAHNVQLFTDYIKSVIQTCEEADRPMMAEAAAQVHCPMKNGYAASFEFSYLNNHYGRDEVKGKFEYDAGLGSWDKFEYESEIPFPSLEFLTKEIFNNEVLPALQLWLEEKVRNESFGGLYGGDFNLELQIGKSDGREYKDYIRVSDPKRKAAQRERVRSFLQDKKYETMDVESEEYEPVLSDIMRIIPTLFGELPTEILKEAICIICRKYNEADSWSISITLLGPLTDLCNKRLRMREHGRHGMKDRGLTTEDISDEELDFMCHIALQILRYADESYWRESGEDILNWISEKGFRKAKDYLKFGTGEIGKEHTHLKTPKFEAIANDIRRTIEFKVKTEDAESYGGMVGFILNLVKQKFPPDYQIKINAKLKHPIPVSGLNKDRRATSFGATPPPSPNYGPK